MTTTYVFGPVSMSSTRYASKHAIKGLAGVLVMAAPACLITFLLIGLWHGAKWTFLLFGFLHSILSIAEYVWRYFKLQKVTEKLGRIGQLVLARSVTFAFVVLTVMLFRSPDLAVSYRYLKDMLGAGGIGNLRDIDLAYFNIALLLLALAISQFAPNTQQMFSRYRPGIFSYREQAKDGLLNWRLTPTASFILGFLFAIALAYIAKGRAAFLYFGF